MKSDKLLVLSTLLASASCFTQQRYQVPVTSGFVKGSRNRFRKNKPYTIMHSAKTQILVTSAGVDYDSTIKVLRKYHEMHGNLVIPRRYRVPSTEDCEYNL